MSRTLGACYVAILLWIRFASLSTELTEGTRCDIRQTLPEFLKASQDKRKIMIKGFIHTSEPSLSRAELALERAKAVKRLLAESGVPEESMVALADGEIPRGIEPRFPVVTFDLVPSEVPVEPVHRPPPACSDLGDGG